MNKEGKHRKNKLFRFKAFSLDDSASPMKIGTDAVLLGAWGGAYAKSNGASYILDIGTGCGIIALMVAQKSHAAIHAIDIDSGAILSATENFQESPWSERLSAARCALQDYYPPDAIQYDIIISNPPYFQDSMVSPCKGRTSARHNQDMSFDDLFAHSKRLLSSQGILMIIYPANQEKRVHQSSARSGLVEYKRLNISSSAGRAPVRIISEYSLSACSGPQILSMSIEKEQRHDFTDEYKTLTFDYHPFFG